jgi:hypothetical protein
MNRQGALRPAGFFDFAFPMPAIYLTAWNSCIASATYLP